MKDSPETVLGVAPGVTLPEAHAAYLALVRRHHPDAHVGEPASVQAAHADQLRAATAAWDELRRVPSPVVTPTATEPAPDDNDEYEGEVEYDVDLESDRPLTAARAGPSLVLLPVVVLVASVVTFCISVVLSAPGLWVASLALLTVSLVLFVLAPFFVMMRAGGGRKSSPS